jgi:hypothetical protein
LAFWFVTEDAENCDIQVAYFVTVIIIICPVGLETRNFDVNVSLVQDTVFKAAF